MEQEIRDLVEQLFNHVASFPWNDQGWVNSDKAKAVAKDQIIESTVRELVKKIGDTNATKEND